MKLYKLLRLGKCIETQTNIEVTSCLVGKGDWELFFNGYNISLQDVEKVLEMYSVVVCTTLGRHLMLLNCALKIIKMVCFTLFCHNKKNLRKLSLKPLNNNNNKISKDLLCI